MSQKFLYLPIESKTRELDAKLLLTYYAIKENYNVILGTHTPIFSHLTFLPNGIIFSKGTPYGDARKEHMANAKKLGYTLVELDEEGLFLNNPYYDRLGRDDHYVKILEHVYCWGDVQKQIITNNFPEFKETFHITGHPRFDLLKKKFRSLYSDEVTTIKQQFGDFILVNTRFTQYNHFIRGLNPNERYIKKIYEHFIELVKELSGKYPNLNIVVRPHIHEGLDIYLKELADYKNVFVAHEGNIVMWILASKAVIHNRCTTGIEAFLLDKPVIAYIPINYEKEKEFLPNAVTYKAVNSNGIFNFIDSCESKGKMDEGKKVLSNYYGTMDEENYAYQNIISLLDKIRLKGENAISESSIQALSTVKGSHTLTSEKEIKGFFERLNKIEKDGNEVIVRTLAPDLFEIKSNRS
ncbi:surface carbohydrate biosynthesis protein [Bacillus pseudomycoides]|uniref:Surface carbohydrate biosynthesis protein n=1 Tax=Bacillus bingmayongensis TaxID=1150157 RepID=A0ABU5JSC3_9BACI|nr:surface carbohydrate biosynthesis protein [Bacillus pseudomycoides]